jgi:hypothetical protein
VLTPSAEQVRKLTYRGALEQWKIFEPWLGLPKESFGDLANRKGAFEYRLNIV